MLYYASTNVRTESEIIRCLSVSVFFFQAEDGIRDWSVTGVQTCALPIFQARAQVGHEAIPRILSRGNGRQAESLRHTHRNVLRGVHGEIGAPVLERGLELLDEKALAPDLGERPIDDLVPSRRDAEDAHLALRIPALELARDVLGLPHREPASARGNDDSFGHLTQRLFPSLPAT